MKLLKPVEVTPARLMASSVAAQDYPAYASGTTYAKGVRVQVGQRNYESLQAANVGRAPDAASSDAWWLDLGATNRWAMFDTQVNTQTVAKAAAGEDVSISVTLALGRVDAVGLIELVGTSVLVEVLESAVSTEPVFSQTVDLVYRNVSTWYGFFTEPLRQRSSIYVSGLPPFSAALLRVTVKGKTEVRCGAVIAGMLADVGRTRHGASVGINDFSRKTTNDFGVTTLVQRGWSKRGSFSVELQQSELERVYDLLASVRGQAVLALGIEAAGYSPTVIYGFVKDFQIDLALAKINYGTLSMEGLV